MRRAWQTDGNQKEIVKALRQCGASVAITSAVGKGFADIVVGIRSSNFLLEIKDPRQPKWNQRLTEDEEIFHATWSGQICIVRSLEEALKVIGF